MSRLLVQLFLFVLGFQMFIYLCVYECIHMHVCVFYMWIFVWICVCMRVHMCILHVHVCVCNYTFADVPPARVGIQWSSYRIHFSPSTVLDLDIELRSSGLDANCFTCWVFAADACLCIRNWFKTAEVFWQWTSFNHFSNYLI